jgi:hypothetical protein
MSPDVIRQIWQQQNNLREAHGGGFVSHTRRRSACALAHGGAPQGSRRAHGHNIRKSVAALVSAAAQIATSRRQFRIFCQRMPLSSFKVQETSLTTTTTATTIIIR